jgi:hypothetical protein
VFSLAYAHLQENPPVLKAVKTPAFCKTSPMDVIDDIFR